MASQCEQIKSQLGNLFQCEQVGEYTRVQTPLLLPDGDVIDIFIRKTDSSFLLTDLGETLRWLKGQTASSRRTNKQMKIVEDICKTLGVSFFRGMISINTNNSDELASKLMEVSQAALRVADISLLFRSRLNELFAEEVEEFLIEHKFAFDKDPTKLGRSGRNWKPNFHVKYNNINSYVFTLSSGTRSVANALINKAYTACSDLSHLRSSPTDTVKFLSIIDDNDDVWTDSDINLLSSASEVSYWRNSDEIIDQLKSA